MLSGTIMDPNTTTLLTVYVLAFVCPCVNCQAILSIAMCGNTAPLCQSSGSAGESSRHPALLHIQLRCRIQFQIKVYITLKGHNVQTVGAIKKTKGEIKDNSDNK